MLAFSKLAKNSSTIKNLPFNRPDLKIINPSLKKSHCRPFTNSGSNDLTVAIIGAGPAGFYTASKLLDKKENVRIDIFEKLPTPYGLVRFGVAPDHPEVKVCTHRFDEIGLDSRVRYFGNVSIGEKDTLSIPTLRDIYDAVVLSYGTSSGRKLNVTGEDGIYDSVSQRQVGGIHSGREFVNYYNGYPTAQHLFESDFLAKGETSRALVFGVGNVALDIARVMLSDIDSLAKTDITERALETLANSKINHVDVIGRRGPLQAAFTTKELRELLTLPNLKFEFDYKMFNESLNNDYAKAILSKSRPLQRKMNLLQKYESSQILQSPAERESSALLNTTFKTQKSWSLRFFESPLQVTNKTQAIHETSEPTKNVNMVKNQMTYQNNGKITLEPTQVYFDLECDVAFKSIGYLSDPVDGAPFDSRKRIIPNLSGRVLDPESDDIVDGLYVSGWVKTGPTGVLANTMQSAYETASAIIDDIDDIGKSVLPETIDRTLAKLGIFQQRIDFESWLKIQKHEASLGKLVGKPSEKLTSIDEMLKVAKL